MILLWRRSIPMLVASGVIAVILLLQAVSEHWRATDLLMRMEWMTYDWRLRWTYNNAPKPIDPRLAGVFIDDGDVRDLNSGALGFQYLFPWPRAVHGRIVRELDAQGAEAIGFDILFFEFHPPRIEEMEELPDGDLQTSDEFFASRIAEAGNVVLATDGTALPPDLFHTNAWKLGSVYSRPDFGVLRRVKPLVEIEDRIWHPIVTDLAVALNFDPDRPIFTPTGQIFFELNQDEQNLWALPLTADGTIDLDELGEDPLPTPPIPFELKRHQAWHLGVVLAARELGVDLQSARFEKDRLILPDSAGGKDRIIPLDQDGFFYIPWSIRWSDLAPSKIAIRDVLIQDYARQQGQTGLENPFADKLIIVGSVATGNNLTDQGATPIAEKAMLVTKHFNVANSVLGDTFIQPYGYATQFWMILLMGSLSASLTWRLRAVLASLAITLAVVIYLVASFLLMAYANYWLPLVLPLLGALIITHSSMITYRVVFEQKERRRVKSVFIKLVSPNVVNELLQAESVDFGGARRELTVLFADVRGFTKMTDQWRSDAEAYVADHKLGRQDAESYYDLQARETLETVNYYLALIANVVKKHQGTLDKYMGDCVMAFWGAPTDDPKHATRCVRAAIDAQRALHRANQERERENQKRVAENERRSQAGLPPLSMLPQLSLGTGINTGTVTVGLMGSDEHILNYTVFGREVNVASRLEGVSGQGRILIGAATHQHLLRDASDLAETCQPLPPVTVKGIQTPVEIFEVPWQLDQEPNTLNPTLGGKSKIK